MELFKTKKILIVLLLTLTQNIYSESVRLIVSSTLKVEVINKSIKYITILPGSEIEIERDLLTQGDLAVKYKDFEIIVHSYYLLGSDDFFHISGVKLTSPNELTLNHVKYEPFKGSNITPTHIIESGLEFEVFETRTFNSEEFCFIFVNVEMFGWIKKSNLVISNETFYSITPNNNLKKSDNIEIDLLKTTDLFERRGLTLKILNNNTVLTDDFTNPNHHTRFRAYDVLQNRYVIYSELKEHYYYYNLLDTQSNLEINFNGIPYPNEELVIATLTENDLQINGPISVSLFDLSNPLNIQKVFQIEVNFEERYEKIHLEWINDESLQVIIKYNNSKTDTLFIRKIQNNWYIDDNINVQIKQKLY